MDTHRRRLAALLIATGLSGCGGGSGGAAGAPPGAGSERATPISVAPAAALPGVEPTVEPGEAPAGTPPPASRAAVRDAAMALWRDGDLSRHPKGSCAGCHGADFFDLARIGSSDEDVVRRALVDGATPAEAENLRLAITHMREDFALPATDARAFRPFQPGGEILMPTLTGGTHEDAVRRDVAFGRSLEPLLPTLFGTRIDSPEAAHRAARELLDVVEGANEAGANGELVQLRDLPNGISYPLWSADLHHGEGTLNDWIADVAHEAPPVERETWFGVQDAWLAEPTRANFWRMYVAAEELVQTTQFGHCAYTGEYTFSEHACPAARRFQTSKFLAALIGQHRLREPFDARAEPLEDGALGFAYLTEDPAFDFMLDRKDPEYLPASPWDVGDDARVMIHREATPGSLREQLGTRGLPDFVIDSVDAERTTREEEEELRVAWFWQGFVMDPSFRRIGKGTSGSAEYMVESFNNTNRFLHLSFSAHVRLVAKGFLSEANVDRVNRRRALEPLEPRFRMDYSYFNGYGRPVLRWKEDRKGGDVVPDALKAEQATLFHRMTANGYRMSLHLWLESLANGTAPKAENLDAILAHFEAYQPEHLAADAALLNRVKLATGDVTLYAVP